MVEGARRHLEYIIKYVSVRYSHEVVVVSLLLCAHSSLGRILHKKFQNIQAFSND